MANVYINELLCYMSNHIKCSTQVHLKNVINTFYSKEEIKCAKVYLWETTSKEGLAQIGKNEIRKISSKHVEDTYNAIRDLDKENLLESYVAKALHRIPKYDPEETVNMAVLERVAALEQKMAINDANISKNSSDISNLFACSKYNPPQGEKTKGQGQGFWERPGSDYARAFPTIDQSSEVENQLLPESNRKDISHNNDSNKQMHTYTLPAQLLRRDFSGSTRSLTQSEKSEPFKHSRQEEKKFQRKEKKKLVTGNNKQGDKNYAREIQHHFHVRNVHPSVEDDDLLELIKTCNATIKTFECVSSESAPAKSYRLSVLACDSQKVLDENLWPEGIYLSRYFFPRKFKEKLIVGHNTRTDNE